MLSMPVSLPVVEDGPRMNDLEGSDEVLDLSLADTGVDPLDGSLSGLVLTIESLDVGVDVISQRQPKLWSGANDAGRADQWRHRNEKLDDLIRSHAGTQGCRGRPSIRADRPIEREQRRKSSKGPTAGIETNGSLVPRRGREQRVDVARIVQRQSPELIPLRRHVALVLAAP